MDERVCLRISAVVKKQENVEHYFRKLQSKLASDQIDYYNVLGNEDFLIEIDDIRLADLLPLYKTEGVLTHMDEAYDQAFYNLSSQIILKKGEYNGTAK